MGPGVTVCALDALPLLGAVAGTASSALAPPWPPLSAAGARTGEGAAVGLGGLPDTVVPLAEPVLALTVAVAVVPFPSPGTVGLSSGRGAATAVGTEVGGLTGRLALVCAEAVVAENPVHGRY
jgi:hypothetical protein